MQQSQFFGRLVSSNQMNMRDLKQIDETYISFPAIKNGRCQRCLSKILPQWQLPTKNYYCGACLQFGRLTSEDSLYTLPEPNAFEKLPSWEWKGKLTKAQTQVEKEMSQHQQNHLVWAVTGAGKTEILFPLIAKALAQKQRVCLATPRIDVVQELAPRIKNVFPEATCIVLHSNGQMPYHYTQLVICTTHQLLKFYHAFDLLIIDEVDAFPFVNNRMLAHTRKRACKITGRQIFLTATPLLKQLVTIKHKSYLPRRFHGFPLPNIRISKAPDWRKKIINNNLPQALEEYIKVNDAKDVPQQCLIFVPTISDVGTVVAALERITDKNQIIGVSSQDEQRSEKVANIRNKVIRYGVTTTILERGVTFADIDVIILGADHINFSSRSLIQIAGRVGRKSSRPNGLVLAIVAQNGMQVLVAKWTIKWLNKQAKKGDNYDM